MAADFGLERRRGSWHYRADMYAHAVITGASSGFGAAFARRLAEQSAHLVLVARRADRLQELAEELRKARPALQVTVCPCDLSDEAARAELAQYLTALPAGSLLLVNNAGMGDYGELLTAEPARVRMQLQLNMAAPVELAHAVLPRLTEQGGGIINLASLAADLFIPDFALYAASKAFVASFSEALRLELRQAGVPVLAVCPGPVHTEFGEVARRHGCSNGYSSFKKWFYTSVDTVVDGSLAALVRGKARYYPSLKIRFAAAVVRCLPLCLLRAVMGCRPRRISKLNPPAA